MIFASRAAAVGAVLLLTLASPSFAAAAAAPTKLLVRFTWKLKGEDAPLFVALDKGYYAAEGLDVDLAEGSGAETVVKLIGAGTDAIGYGPASTAAEAISAGLPITVVAIYQSMTPIGLISFPDVALKVPKDLEGKRLGLVTGETFVNMLAPFAEINHVDLSKVTRVAMENGARNGQFMARKIDVMSVYLNNELPLVEHKTGIKFNVLSVSDFGLKLLGASFFVNTGFAQAHPDEIKALLRATAKGYADAFADPSGAAALMNKHFKIKMDPATIEDQVKATLAATTRPAGHPLGWQDKAAWQANLALLKSTDSIKRIRRLDAYYTNAFLQ